MATVDEVMDAVRAYGVLSMRLGVDYLSETLVERHEQFNRIRSMLAPVAPDPGLREAIARRMYADADAYAVSLGASSVAWEDCGGQQRWYYRRADSAIAVLAGRGMA